MVDPVHMVAVEVVAVLSMTPLFLFHLDHMLLLLVEVELEDQQEVSLLLLQALSAEVAVEEGNIHQLQ